MVGNLKSTLNKQLRERFVNVVHNDERDPYWLRHASKCKSYSVTNELFKKGTNGVCTYTADAIKIVSDGTLYNAVDFYILDDVAPGTTVTVSATRTGGNSSYAIFIRAFNGMPGALTLDDANIISWTQGSGTVSYVVPKASYFIHIGFVGSRGTAWTEDSEAIFSNVSITWENHNSNQDAKIDELSKRKFLKVLHGKKAYLVGNASNCKNYIISGENIKKDSTGKCTYTVDSLKIISAGGKYNAVDFYILDPVPPGTVVSVSGSRTGGLNDMFTIRGFNSMGDDMKMTDKNNIITARSGNDQVLYTVTRDTLFIHIIIVGSRGTTWAEDSEAIFSDLTITWESGGIDNTAIVALQKQIDENTQAIEDIEQLSGIETYVNAINQEINRFSAKVNDLNQIIGEDLTINDALNPTPILFDTDFGGDSDDAMAVRMLSYYESIGSVRIVFASLSNADLSCLKGMNALFEYDGTFDVPIIMPSSSTYERTTGYGAVLAQYPHTLNTPYSVYGYKAYRKALASLDRKAVIVAVGSYGNISNLLNSTADEYSDLTGIQLVQQKVSKLVLMGGAFPNSLTAMGSAGAVVNGVQTPGAEWNFAGNISATNNVITNCPVPIIFCGWEIGHAIKCGGGISDKLPTDDAMIAALHEHGGTSEVTNGRDGYDPITVAIACVGDARKIGYQLVRGTISYDTTTSRNTFTESPSGNHYYVKTKYAVDYYQKYMNHPLAKDWWSNVNSSSLDRLI